MLPPSHMTLKRNREGIKHRPASCSCVVPSDTQRMGDFCFVDEEERKQCLGGRVPQNSWRAFFNFFQNLKNLEKLSQ